MRDFKIKVEPEKFLNLVYAPSSLEERLKEVNLVISFRDASKFWKNGARIRIEVMPINELEAILRSVKDRKGREPYQKSNIVVKKIDTHDVYCIQLFVQVNKLIELSGLAEILREFGSSLIEAPGLYLIVEVENERYLAFYLPPIVEMRRSDEIVEYGLKIIEEIQSGKEERIYILPGIYGDVEVDILKIIMDVIAEVKKRDVVKYVLDGTHRYYLANTLGTSIRSTVIEKPEGKLETFPPSIKHLVVTREKPVKKYRFIGYNERAWHNLKDLYDG